MPPYYYEPLGDKETIRLVAILTGRRDFPLARCNIIQHSLIPPEESYETLSYTWGDAFDRVIILCGEPPCELLVTSNCYNALIQLMLEDVTRLVWIDAIGINQYDLAERNAQVRMMDRIFAFEDQVIAYLGEEDERTRLLFEDIW